LKEFAPWGPPWHKEKILNGYKTAYDAVSSIPMANDYSYREEDNPVVRVFGVRLSSSPNS